MGYGRKAWDIVGYTYAADIVCPDHVVSGMGEHRRENENAEHALDRIAMRRGIDRQDERSFDSDDFPKVIFADSVTDDDICGSCGEAL